MRSLEPKNRPKKNYDIPRPDLQRIKKIVEFHYGFLPDDDEIVSIDEGLRNQYSVLHDQYIIRELLTRKVSDILVAQGSKLSSFTSHGWISVLASLAAIWIAALLIIVIWPEVVPFNIFWVSWASLGLQWIVLMIIAAVAGSRVTVETDKIPDVRAPAGIAIGKIPDVRAPGGIAVGEGSVWVTSMYKGWVARIDPRQTQLFPLFRSLISHRRGYLA